jgi:hypothetical protein
MPIESSLQESDGEAVRKIHWAVQNASNASASASCVCVAASFSLFPEELEGEKGSTLTIKAPTHLSIDVA